MKYRFYHKLWACLDEGNGNLYEDSFFAFSWSDWEKSRIMRFEWGIFQIPICSIIVTLAYSAPHVLILLLFVYLLLASIFSSLPLHGYTDHINERSHPACTVTKLRVDRSGVQFLTGTRALFLLQSIQTKYVSPIILHGVCRKHECWWNMILPGFLQPALSTLISVSMLILAHISMSIFQDTCIIEIPMFDFPHHTSVFNQEILIVYVIQFNHTKFNMKESIFPMQQLWPCICVLHLVCLQAYHHPVRREWPLSRLRILPARALWGHIHIVMPWWSALHGQITDGIIRLGPSMTLRFAHTIKLHLLE